MLDVKFLADLITLTLRDTPFPSPAESVQLILGTGAVESALTYTRQHGGGPARSFWQLEPTTAKEHHVWLMAHHPQVLERYAGVQYFSLERLEHNLCYGILLCRTHYYRRDPQPMPDLGDIKACAHRWKQFYNTRAGKGTVEKYLEAWETLIAPYGSRTGFWPATT